MPKEGVATKRNAKATKVKRQTDSITKLQLSVNAQPSVRLSLDGLQYRLQFAADSASSNSYAAGLILVPLIHRTVLSLLVSPT